MDAGLSVVDIDPNFEPQIRARSNTWPSRPVEDFGEAQQQSPASDDPGIADHTKDALGIKQKTSSRRNAWGNLSYADLITKAIQSSPEQRLTLSQIYDWMVQNVPYFKDKGDNTSSAGWKNSIRHNLSLHSRFMRIQNEGTGKSSWWVINPDAKPGKAPRRRAGSMETKSYEKKRGRINKKRIEALRAAQENGTLNTDDYPEYHFNSSLSPEFRGRAGSNASSCGRLSPIQAAVEPDLHDSQVPPMSPIPWATELEADDFVNTNSSESFSLVDSLVGGLNLKETGNLAGDQNDVEMNTLKQQLMSGGSLIRYNSPNSFEEGGYGGMPAPPSYSDHLQQQQQTSQRTVLNLDTMASQNRNYTNLTSKQPMDVYPDNVMTSQMMSSQNMASPGSNSLGVNVSPQINSPARSPQLSPSNYPPGSYSPQTMKRSPQQQMMPGPPSPQQQQQQQGGTGNRSLLQQCLEAPTDSMLRQALTQQMNPTYHGGMSPSSQPSQQQHPPQLAYSMPYGGGQGFSRPALHNLNPGGLNNINNNITMLPQSASNNCGPMQNISQMSLIGPQMVTNSSGASLSEIDTENMLDLDYDVEQLLRQELAIDPSLDFDSFESSQSTQNVPTSDNQNLVR